MSTIFFIRSKNILTPPYGFNRLKNHTAFIFFEDKQHGKTEGLAMSPDGEFFFPEDYANKKQYLQAVKSKGGSVFSDYYRLRIDTIALLKTLPSGLTFGLLDITEYSDDTKALFKIRTAEMNNRVAFKYGRLYEMI